MKTTETEYNKKVDMLHSKIKTLQKEVATLSKSNKRANIGAGNLGSGGAGSGSGTDSPSIP